MRKWQLIIFSLFLLLGLFTSRVILEPAPPPEPAILAEVTNSATIPAKRTEQYFTYSLFGYTSSYANVKLEGINLLQGTKADKNGYFEFINFKASNQNKEFCLLTIDTEGLVAPPLCFPAPTAETNRKYGPYLLPPTLKLAKGDIKTNEASEVSGKTIPGSSVNINVFSEPGRSLAGLVVKPALAENANKNTANKVLKLNTNSDGSFSTTLKDNVSGKKRIFAQSVFNLNQSDNKTPKSVTLTLNIVNLFLALLIQLLDALKSLFNLNTILFLQVLLIAFLLLKRKQIFSWYYLYRHKKTAIMLYRRQVLAKIIKNYCPL